MGFIGAAVFVHMLFGAFLTEAITELVIKSELFRPLRELFKGVWFLGKLLRCGYCFSFWVAFMLVCLGVLPFTLAHPKVLNLVISVLLVQRGSNIIHNCIDKWTDKYFSLAHTNSDKSEE